MENWDSDDLPYEMTTIAHLYEDVVVDVAITGFSLEYLITKISELVALTNSNRKNMPYFATKDLRRGLLAL